MVLCYSSLSRPIQKISINGSCPAFFFIHVNWAFPPWNWFWKEIFPVGVKRDSQQVATCLFWERADIAPVFIFAMSVWNGHNVSSSLRVSKLHFLLDNNEQAINISPGPERGRGLFHPMSKSMLPSSGSQPPHPHHQDRNQDFVLMTRNFNANLLGKP